MPPLNLIPEGTTITVETKWFPPLVVEVTNDDSPPNLVMRALKPKVTIAIKGTKITSIAPAGEPVPNEWPKVKIGLAIAAAVVAFSILRIIK